MSDTVPGIQDPGMNKKDKIEALMVLTVYYGEGEMDYQ